MTWTANIIDVKKNELDIEITVEFTNGTITKSVPFRVHEPSSIDNIIKQQLNQYTKVEQASVQVGVVDLSAKPVTPPSRAEVDASAFTANLNLYRKTLEAEKLGITVSPTAAEILQTLKDTYLPEYIELL